MRIVFIAVTMILLVGVSPAVAQTSCIDLCSVLPNCGFDEMFKGWTCTHPNDNYRCPLSWDAGDPGAPNGPFVDVVNRGDRDVAGKLVHDAEPVAFPAGTCFQVSVLAQRGRTPNAPPLFTSARPTLHLQILGWKEGSEPVISPETDNWSRRPNAMSCSRLFTEWPQQHSEGNWYQQTFQCTAAQNVSWVSLSIAAANHSHDSYVFFDTETEACQSNAGCAVGLFCKKEQGDCQGFGTCQRPSDFCITDPGTPLVCGCDGTTYVNGCAAVAGVNVDHAGSCTPP